MSRARIAWVNRGTTQGSDTIPHRIDPRIAFGNKYRDAEEIGAYHGLNGDPCNPDGLYSATADAVDKAAYLKGYAEGAAKRAKRR
jgi:hypothetical protein